MESVLPISDWANTVTVGYHPAAVISAVYLCPVLLEVDKWTNNEVQDLLNLHLEDHNQQHLETVPAKL